MIKIALISDIHFGKDSRSFDFAIPGQKITDETAGGKSLYSDLELKLSVYKPDYIFCAGDLTSSGKPLEFKICLERLYNLAEKASVPKRNVIYCFGNHDVDWSLMAHSSNKGEYECLDRNFTSEEVTFLTNYYSGISHIWLQNMPYVNENEPYCSLFSTVGPIPMTGLIDREDIAIFVLNSGFQCSPHQGKNHGQITVKQLEWLESELKRINNDKKWKIIILHHHPFTYTYPIIYHEYSTLEEGPQLQDLCGKYGVNLVIHGHYHFPRAETKRTSGWNNPVTFISAGSLSVNQSGRLSGAIPNTFHFVQLEEYPQQIKLITYEYSIGYGWDEEVKNRKSLPLDHEMLFGDLAVGDEEAKEIIKDFPIEQLISYDSIDNKLKYIAVSRLNKLLVEVHGLNLSGSFPSGIRIHKDSEEG